MSSAPNASCSRPVRPSALISAWPAPARTEWTGSMPSGSAARVSSVSCRTAAMATATANGTSAQPVYSSRVRRSPARTASVGLPAAVSEGTSRRLLIISQRAGQQPDRHRGGEGQPGQPVHLHVGEPGPSGAGEIVPAGPAASGGTPAGDGREPAGFAGLAPARGVQLGGAYLASRYAGCDAAARVFRLCVLRLCVPKTSSKLCDHAIFVDQATDASVSSDAVLVEIDRFGQPLQRRGAVQGAVRPMLVVVGLVLAQDAPQMVLVPDEGAVQKLAAASPDPVRFQKWA